MNPKVLAERQPIDVDFESTGHSRTEDMPYSLEREAVDRILDHLWQDYLHDEKGVFLQDVTDAWKEVTDQTIHNHRLCRVARRLEAGGIAAVRKHSDSGYQAQLTEAGIDTLFDCVDDPESYELLLAVAEQLTPTEPKQSTKR